jgi:hypothetical protein
MPELDELDRSATTAPSELLVLAQIPDDSHKYSKNEKHVKQLKDNHFQKKTCLTRA